MADLPRMLGGEVEVSDVEFNRRYEDMQGFLTELREAVFLKFGAEGRHKVEMALNFDANSLKKAEVDWKELVEKHMEKYNSQLKVKEKKDEELVKFAQKAVDRLKNRGVEISGKAAKKFLYNKLSDDVRDCVATITKAEKAKVISKKNAGALRRMATNWDWKIKKNARGQGQLTKELERQMNAAGILVDSDSD